MNNSLQEIKKKVMRRIYFVFLVHNTAPLAFDCLFIVIIAFLASFFVSIKDVLVNLSVANENGSIAGFSESAFSDTELSTKFLMLALGFVGFLAIRHLRRAVRAVKAIHFKDSEVAR